MWSSQAHLLVVGDGVFVGHGLHDEVQLVPAGCSGSLQAEWPSSTSKNAIKVEPLVNFKY